MKKLLLTLLILPASLAAQAGPQPLYFSNITINPQGCGSVENPSPTSNILVTAAGGQPPYTYTLLVETSPFGGSPLTTPTANFASVPVVDSPVTLMVTDSANNSVTSVISLSESQTLQIIMNITSLPLGNAPGCISVQVVGPGGKLFGSAGVGIGSTLAIAAKNAGTIIPAPFTQQFAAFRTPGTSTLTAQIVIQNDCGIDEASVFDITFPFPQGNSNTLKAYVFNKYCSCALSSNTILVS